MWVPVDNGGCVHAESNVNLAGFRTADLYLRMKRDASAPNTAPFRVQYVQSGTAGASVPITFTGGLTVGGGGRFHQNTSGGNFRAQASDLAEFPCLQFDTYVTINTGATELVEGQPASAFESLFLTFTQTTLGGLWIVPGFSASNAVNAVAEPIRFPNDECGRYVRVGRFTITQGATLSGTVFAVISRTGQSTTSAVEVQVPNCATCWGQPATP